jgi:SAM-dependent methyltransferase
MPALTVPESAPSLGILEEIDEHVTRTHLVRAALELEVIPAIARGSRTVEEVARATGCSTSGIRILLDGLCALRLLRPFEGGYALTDLSETYLVPDSRSYCAPMFLDDLRAWDRFTESVRTGSVPRDYGAGESDRVWAAWAARQLANWPNDLPTYRSRWEGLGITPESMPRARVVDVGCGSALPTLTLAVGHPGATVTGIDREAVVAVAGRLADELGVRSRVQLITGDVTTLGRLPGPYDIVFFGHIFKFLAAGEIAFSLRQARRLLAAGGRVVIVEVIGEPDNYENVDQHLIGAWVFHIAPRGRIYSLADFDAMLHEAGFGPARRLADTTWLEAKVGP